MTTSAAKRLAWAFWAGVLAAMVGGVVFVLLNPARTSVPATVLSEVTLMVFPTVGLLIATHRPQNALGWIFLAIGATIELGTLGGEYSWYSVATHAGSLPFTASVNAISGNWWAPALGMVGVYSLLLFPEGHLPSPRWRWCAWPAGIGIGLVVLAGTFIETSDNFPGAPANPFASPGLQTAAQIVFLIGAFAFLPAIPISAVGLILRFRRSRGDEHEQLKWLAFGGAIVAVALIVGLGFDWSGHSDARANVLAFGVLAVPICAGIAILRYRLFDVDVVIKKTVVLSVLAVFLTLLYLGLLAVATLGNVSRLVVGALLFAVTFNPVRRAARVIADRIVYGKRASSYEVLTSFSERMGETYSTEDVLPRLASVLRAATGAGRATVWLRVGDELRPAARAPGAVGDVSAIRVIGEELPQVPGSLVADVRDGGELLGALVVDMPPNDPLDRARERIVRDLASQAGLVLRNVRLVEEIRASRQRLVAAQDEERRKIERNLHDGAQQQLVALTVQLGLLERQAEDPERVRQSAGRLKEALGDALEDLRTLARGIYPPLLADQGLAVALQAQSRKGAVPITIEPDGIGRYPREIESAVYFCALEALQNVAKYAEASSATVRLHEAGGVLTFAVEDDGRGFDPDATGYGTGLQGIADRISALGGEIEVTSSPDRGTTVVGRLPVEVSP